MQVRFPPSVLMEQVQALLPAIPMAMGSKFISEHKTLPFVIFLPERAKASDKVPTRGMAEHRTTVAWDIDVAITIFGRDMDDVWSVANNVEKALRDCALADLRPGGLEFVSLGESQVQGSECAVFSVTVPGCFQDVYVDVATNEAADVATIVPTSITGRFESADMVNDPDAEYAFTIET